ncbi:MAG: hypothetical protein Kow00121_00740 [Elainellaceae cyanobacterium]
MNAPAANRQKLIEMVNTLPDNVLVELASFIDYLHYKSSQPHETEERGSAFLLSIAGLGTSKDSNVSERDEEILQAEIDPVQGWHHGSDRSV